MHKWEKSERGAEILSAQSWFISFSVEEAKPNIGSSTRSK